jgi:hypothetical protein
MPVRLTLERAASPEVLHGDQVPVQEFSVAVAGTISWRRAFMRAFVIGAPLLGFVVGTRAILALGVGLIVADRIPEPRRRAIAMTLIGIGAATTLPAVKALFESRQAQVSATTGQVDRGRGQRRDC